MADYTNQELIVVYRGSKSSFSTNTLDYVGKLVVITGSDTSGATDNDRRPYLYVSGYDGEGKVVSKYIQIPYSYLAQLQVGDKSVSGTGAVTKFAGSNGISVAIGDNNQITIDASELEGIVNGHTTAIGNAQKKADDAYSLAYPTDQKVKTLIGNDTGSSVRDIAQDVADTLKEEILGDAENGDTIAGLRADVDEVSGKVVTLTGTGDGSISQMISLAIDAFAGSIDNNKTIDNLRELLDYVSGVDGSQKLATAIAQIEQNKNSISALQGSDTDNGSVRNLIKTAIASEVTRADSAYATKAQGAKADTAIQDVDAGGNFIEVSGDGTSRAVSAKTAELGNMTDSTDGLATVADIRAYLKARLTIKVI